ncbi:MAG: phosphate ABC transporter ATP-binding protein [Elusimicrobia bacterium]|nr:phosphate ABC transporter ATP-binding protein [Elusimicrobiota bacterium]
MDKVIVENLKVKKGNVAILRGISLTIRTHEILAVIGPAGSGKTTFLRCLNRLIDLEPELKPEGRITLEGVKIYGEGTDVSFLRRRIGMVFAVPNPLPMSILDNLTLGLRIHGLGGSGPITLERVERSLKAAYLWEEVKDRLKESALKLSGGQQQRLCLARSIMVDPELLLLDEPCSGLDPISTAKIEEALQGLKREMSIVLVTNNVKQASRCSDRTAFLLMGDLVEINNTDQIFTNPQDGRTSDYVSGRFG